MTTSAQVPNQWIAAQAMDPLKPDPCPLSRHWIAGKCNMGHWVFDRCQIGKVSFQKHMGYARSVLDYSSGSSYPVSLGSNSELGIYTGFLLNEDFPSSYTSSFPTT